MLAYNGSVPGPTLQVEQGRETQQPIPVGGCYSCQVQFPRRRLPLVSPAHQGRTSLRRWASREPIVVEPTDAAYWPDVDCQLTMTLDDLLERGHIVPFHRSGRTVTAMGPIRQRAAHSG
jgi:hypothetical protein